MLAQQPLPLPADEPEPLEAEPPAAHPFAALSQLRKKPAG